MIALLVWLAGTLAMLWVMTTHHYWQDLLAACASLVLLLWVVGGAAAISALHKGGLKKMRDKLEIENAVRHAQARERADQLRREGAPK